MDQNTNTKICFEVRASCSTSPPTPPCRISNPLSPTEGTSIEEDLLQHQEYQTPLSTLQSHRGYTTTIHLYRRGIRPVANTNTITSTEEVYNQISTSHQREQTNNPITQPQPLPKREQPRNQGFTKVVSFNHKPLSFFFFHKNKILIDQDSMIAQVQKQGVFGNKQQRKTNWEVSCK